MKTEQTEIPGTESRDPELHALGLELHHLQNQRMEFTKLEKEKRIAIGDLLKAQKRDHYNVDGVQLWVEPGADKVKVKLGGGARDEEAEE